MTRVDLANEAEWRRASREFQDHNYRQTWSYGVAVAKKTNSTSEHVVIRKAGEIQALADVRVKQLPVLGGGIAYIDGGPLAIKGTIGEDCERFAESLRALVMEYVERRKLVLRIRLSVNGPEHTAGQVRILKENGFVDATQADRYQTIVVDLERPLEEIRKSFRQEWRRGLNRAWEKELRVRTGCTLELFGDFCSLFDELTERKGFGVNLDADFYRAVQAQLGEEERFQIIIVDAGGQVVSGHVSCMLGKTCQWVLGATNGEGRKTRAAYLMHWEAMTLARQLGCSRYDLGGVDPEGNPGVYFFKKGIGGVESTVPGPFERRPRGLRDIAAKCGEAAYRKFFCSR